METIPAASDLLKTGTLGQGQPTCPQSRQALLATGQWVPRPKAMVQETVSHGSCKLLEANPGIWSGTCAALGFPLPVYYWMFHFGT